MSTNVKKLKSSSLQPSAFSLQPSAFSLQPSAFSLASTVNINADLLSQGRLSRWLEEKLLRL